MAGKAGQIIPRGERTWLVRVFMGRDSESGKRKYVNKTIHGTLRDAQAYLSRSQRDRDLGVFFEPSRMSLDGYLNKWLETAAKPKLRAKTHRDYEALLRRYVRPALGSRPASKIEPLEIQGPVCGDAGARPIGGPNGPVHTCGSSLRPPAGRKVDCPERLGGGDGYR